MENREDYTPQRIRQTKQKKRRHPVRNFLIVLFLLILSFLAFQVKRYLSEPIMPRTDTSQSVDASDSNTPASTEPSTSGGDSSAPSDAAASDASPSPADTSTPTDATASTDNGGSIDLLMLVNSTHALPDGYNIELTTLGNGQQVAQIIYPELQRMFDDARTQGVYPIVASGYRTAEKQQSLMDEKVQSLEGQGYSEADAKTEALKWVNAVGYSEHQSGLAVDINADGVHSSGWQVYNWLAEHAWEYGFILRYPDGKTDITGTGYEPWHYRYVGTDAAKEIHTQGVCLEEYLNAVN